MNELSIVTSYENGMAYSSKVCKTDKETIELFNATSSPDKKLREFVGKTISLKDIYIEPVEIKDDKTEQMVIAPRIVLIDSDGVSYGCVSGGIYSILKRIISIFGDPSTWEKPKNVEVVQIPSRKNAGTILSLKLV